MKQIRQLISLILAMAMLCSFFPVAAMDTSAAEVSEDTILETLPTMTTEVPVETTVEEVPSETEQQEIIPVETEATIGEVIPPEIETTDDETTPEETIEAEVTIPAESKDAEMKDSQDNIADFIIDDTTLHSQTLVGDSGNQTSAAYPKHLPSIGNPKVLVFYITMPEGIPGWDLDLDEVENLFFSESGESLRTFYEKSSYGKVHIEGTVYEYTTKQDVYHYTNSLMIIDEIIEHYRNIINWDDYDADMDGCIDGIYIVPKTDYAWDGANFVATCNQSVGNLTTNMYCLMRSQDLNTLCHETCHMFGIPDIYAGSGLNPQGSNTDSIMDDDGSEYQYQGTGDLPGILKYALGWIDNPVFISGTGTRDLTLQSVSTNGEIAIIYPNGDAVNNNWIVVEYLTEDANNHHSGVRIWKTRILRGEENTTVEFRYLEAISPFGVKNYYFNAGESVTPYTYPSTSYGVTYRSAGGSKTTNTCFDEIGFSGISIHVNSTNEQCAELTVSIDNTIKDIPGTAVLSISDSASDVIVDSTKTLIATIESGLEMMVTGEIVLKDNASGMIIPVEPVFNAYSNILYLYVSQENMDSLIAGETYLINLNDTVKTYYGSDISIKDFSGTILINKFGTPIPAEGPYETSFFGLPLNDFYAPNVFQVDSTHTMHFGYVDYALFMRTHDITTQQYTDVKVAVNPPPGELQIDQVLQIDEKYYAVLFRHSLEERHIAHIAVYDTEGRLIDEYTPSDTVIYVGGHNQPLVVKDSETQELKVKNGQLNFETVNYFSRFSTDAIKASRYKLTDTLFAHVARVYTPSEHVTITLFMGSSDDTAVLEYDNTREVDIIYKDDKLYVLTAGEDLILHIYDSSIALIEESVLLKHINMKKGIRDLELGIAGNSVWSSFIGISYINEVNYTNSYLLVFTPNVPTQYYRYGDISSTYIGDFCYMGNGTFVMATKNPYYVLKTNVDDHVCQYTSSIVAPTCTEQGYTIHTCTGCNKSYMDNYVAARGHSWDKGVVTKKPTADASGIRIYTCSVCKDTFEEVIPALTAVSRISGKDRVKTALSVAKALKDTLKVDKFDAVIIATGVNEKFADALAGSYLANRKKAPILLYTNSGLSQLNVNFIRENLKANGTVYILGGDSAVATTVEQTLSAYKVVRLSGKTRYETNLAILKEAGISGNEILVATGTNFADSLSASAVGLPLLLVNGKNTAPNAVQTEFLKSVAGKKIIIIGGDGAVSEEMKAAIEKITGVTAERISGKTRHNTSVMIAQKYFADADFALITYAKNFPDGLAGGPLAYAMGAPLLLTSAGQEGIAGDYITAGSIENGYVLGGDSAVSDETARKVFGLAAGTAIEKAYYTE